MVPAKMAKKSECVKVVVRCRPMNEKEVASSFARVVEMDVQKGQVVLQNPKARQDEIPREFTFDAVYDWNSIQRDLYDETFRPIVDSVLEGYNGTIFAYGQTGTGKTYTMEGVRSNPEERGVIPNSFNHVFTHIARTQNMKFLVRASYLEIYQEEIRDLLSKNHEARLELRERPGTGVYIKDISSFVAKSEKEIQHVMSVGNQNRKVGRTDMNEHSSRSHAVFILTVECANVDRDGKDHIRVGKLNLVDLAGSERQAKTGSTGERFKEATKINLSLSALGNVISALIEAKSTHIPYRDSKLTRLLQDSLGGNAKTCMVATIGPANYNYDETLTTLRYANRAKNIKNKPRINEDPQDALLREYQEEIKKLKGSLDKRMGKKGKKKKRGQGEEGEDEEEEADNQPELSLKEEQAKVEQEKEMIQKNQALLKEEKQKLLQEASTRVEQMKKEQNKRDVLAAKIKAMESKLLAGGENIFDKTNEQERELERQRQEIIDQKRKERVIKQELQAKEETTMEMKGTYTSLQEEVETKTKKLSKLHSKLKSVRREISDLKLEQADTRAELLLTLDHLHKEIKLRTLIVENFIPADFTSRLKERAEYNEEEEQWSLKPIEIARDEGGPEFKRPVSALGNIRPIATHARLAARTGNPRYKAENILQLELDMPVSTTREYESSGMAPIVQAMLDAALNEEKDITIDANAIEEVTGGPGVPKSHRRTTTNNKNRKKKTSKDMTGGLGGVGSSKKAENFPVTRGLVQPTVRFA